MPEQERTFVFWFMSNVLRLELQASSEEAAWKKLETAIHTDLGTQQAGLLTLDGDAQLSIARIDDVDRWEMEKEDEDA